jgi:hypothetical protein
MSAQLPAMLPPNPDPCDNCQQCNDKADAVIYSRKRIAFDMLSLGLLQGPDLGSFNVSRVSQLDSLRKGNK